MAAASTLSIASQTSGVGSPKPEKRQANSPLPPPPLPPPPPPPPPLLPPTPGADVSGADGVGLRKSVNVDDMYAKVIKKKVFSVPPNYTVRPPPRA